MKKLFVGNLSWKATEDDLVAFFKKAGQVKSAKIVKDKDTDKSKGFGFVEMENEEDAQKAIELLNDTPLLDRNIRVSLAQERTERRDNFRSAPGGRGGHRPYQRAERSY